MRTPLDLIIDVVAALKDNDGPEICPELWEELQDWAMLTVNAQGANEIGRERFRQINEEGYDLNHDDDYKSNELINAATSYLLACDGHVKFREAEENWPWVAELFKPKDTWSNLIKAGALIAAELDRLRGERVRAFIQRKLDADPNFFSALGSERRR